MLSISLIKIVQWKAFAFVLAANHFQDLSHVTYDVKGFRGNSQNFDRKKLGSNYIFFIITNKQLLST